ncbi:MAG: metallophosphoesterase family protein [bacterium]
MAGKRYAILGDIHGNLEALQAVLEDAHAQGATDYACVGDLVGYNAKPAETLHRVRELGMVCVRGNHDHYVAHEELARDFHPLAANVVDWTRMQIGEDNISFLRTLSMKRMLSGFLLVHSTLDMPEKWGYVFDELEAEASFNYQSTSLCFHGHTHQPVIFEKDVAVTRLNSMRATITLGKKYFVNVGSVGQPRDGDPRASYGLYDTVERAVELRRVVYDIASAQRQILDAGLPARLAIRLATGI